MILLWPTANDHRLRKVGILDVCDRSPIIRACENAEIHAVSEQHKGSQIMSVGKGHDVTSIKDYTL